MILLKDLCWKKIQYNIGFPTFKLLPNTKNCWRLNITFDGIGLLFWSTDEYVFFYFERKSFKEST